MFRKFRVEGLRVSIIKGLGECRVEGLGLIKGSGRGSEVFRRLRV